MKVFPELSVKPSVKKFSQSLLIDPIHRAKMASGAVLTRPLFTDIPVKLNVSYSLMPDADRGTLETWERDTIKYGEEKFEWTNPQNNKTYVTMLIGLIKYQAHSKSKGDIWLVKFDIITLLEI